MLTRQELLALREYLGRLTRDQAARRPFGVDLDTIKQHVRQMIAEADDFIDEDDEFIVGFDPWGVTDLMALPTDYLRVGARIIREVNRRWPDALDSLDLRGDGDQVVINIGDTLRATGSLGWIRMADGCEVTGVIEWNPGRGIWEQITEED